MKKVPILLVLAVVVAFVLRFWHLSTIPYPPDGDEVAFGYYGWSLLHYGTDEYGTKLPTSFNSIGDYKYPGLAYLNIIPAAIFGLSNLTVRFWNAFAGVALVVLVYLLANYFFSNKKIALFAASSIALSPWAIIVSRLGYETSISAVLTTAGIVCLLYLTRIKNRKTAYILYGASFMFFAISIFTFAASRFFIPSFLLGIIGLSFTKDNPLKQIRGAVLLFFVVLSSIVLISLISPSNWGRAKEVVWSGITGTESNRLQELYVEAGTSIIKLPPRVTWLFHNKYRIALFDFIDRYSQHFSVSYLFTTGEEMGQKIPDMGVLLLIDLILLPFGLVALIKNHSGNAVKVLLLWLILAPIPSALTVNNVKMIRATLLIVPLSILSGLGFNYITGLFKNKHMYVATLLVLAFVASALYALNQIFVQKPLDKPWTNQTVGEKLTKTVLNLKNNYKAVAAGGDDYIFFLFYGKISPPDFTKRSDIEPLLQTKWNRVNRLDNIYFKMPFKCPMGGKLNVLYICEGVEVPQNAKVVDVFYYPDGVPAYSLIEFYPESQMPPQGHLPILPDKFKYMVDIEHKYPDGIIPAESSSLW